MKVILFGATGMVGGGVLLECLDDARVELVLSIGRTTTGRVHPKLREVQRADLFAYDDLVPELGDKDACFFCLGVSSLGMDEPTYTRLTFDLTMAAAKAIVSASPGAAFCYVSGVGTDSTEVGRTMWARVKGRTENALLVLPFRAAYMFRPGYIQPLRGVRSRTGWVQGLYTVVAPLYPLVSKFLGGSATTTVNLGRAMIQVAASGYKERILHAREINELAGTTEHHRTP